MRSVSHITKILLVDAEPKVSLILSEVFNMVNNYNSTQNYIFKTKTIEK